MTRSIEKNQARSRASLELEQPSRVEQESRLLNLHYLEQNLDQFFFWMSPT